MEETSNHHFLSLFETKGSIPKKTGWNFAGTWCYYRIFHSLGKLLFLDNDDNATKINVTSHYKSPNEFCVPMPNYLGIYSPEENKLIVYSKLLKEYATVFFPKGYCSHSFIETSRGPIIIMIIGRQIKVYSIDAGREVSSYDHDAPIFCGIRGIYKNLEDKVICIPYFPSDESFELPSSIQKITGVIPTYKSIDTIFTEEDFNNSFVYDIDSKTILHKIIGRVRIFDFLFLTKSKIIDFRTKDPPNISLKEIVYITRKNNEDGYYIWKI